MKSIRSVLCRYRLITNVLTLVLLLGVLAVTPVDGGDMEVGGWETCSTSCVNWNKQDGCVTCQHCCVDKAGRYECWELQPNACA